MPSSQQFSPWSHESTHTTKRGIHHGSSQCFFHIQYGSSPNTWEVAVSYYCLWTLFIRERERKFDYCYNNNNGRSVKLKWKVIMQIEPSAELAVGDNWVKSRCLFRGCLVHFLKHLIHWKLLIVGRITCFFRSLLWKQIYWFLHRDQSCSNIPFVKGNVFG